MVARIILPPLVLLFAFGACTASSPIAPAVIPPHTPNPPLQITPVTCPSTTLTHFPRHNVPPGSGHVLVPPAPAVLVLCSGPSRVVVRGQPMDRLVASLNELKHEPPNAEFACPADLGFTYTLYFDYLQGWRLTVTVNSSGCAFASNGQVTASTDTDVLQQILTLLRSPPPSAP